MGNLYKNISICKNWFPPIRVATNMTINMLAKWVSDLGKPSNVLICLDPLPRPIIRKKIRKFLYYSWPPPSFLKYGNLNILGGVLKTKFFIFHHRDCKIGQSHWINSKLFTLHFNWKYRFLINYISNTF